jgi:DNA adenine methylase Dam
MDAFKIIRGPIAYQGSKFKLVDQIKSLLGEYKVLHDVFGGSGVIALNALGQGKKVHYNEYDKNVFSIMEFIKTTSESDKLIKLLNTEIKRNKLGREAQDEDAYYRYRQRCNKNMTPDRLWVLSKHSFSSLIRFNAEGEFNLPFGFRTSNPSNSRDAHITEIWNRLQNIKLHNLCYLQYVKKAIKKIDKNHVFYFDPPYSASGDNVYEGNWNKDNDLKLFSMLDYLDGLGIRWILSNCVQHRGHKNKELAKWMKQYKVIYPEFRTKGEAYTLNRAVDNKLNNTVEVIVKNY